MKNEKIRSFLIEQNATVVDAMKKIDFNAKGILFVVDNDEHLMGVITDGDIRRWLIKTGNLQEIVKNIMNSTPKSIYCKEISNARDLMDRYQITAIPVLTVKNRISDIIFKDNEDADIQCDDLSLNDVCVVIMAGGKGTRLYPYTKILPKPLIPIGDVPIMERIINSFQKFGVKDFYATLNYKKEMIKSYFAEADIEYSLKYAEETEPLGTAGSLRLIKDKFENPFIVTNCDILIQANYSDIYKYHKDMGNEMTIITALKNIVIPYGVINSSENGKIDSIEEKPRLSYLVNTGMYVLNADLINEIPENTIYHMTDLVDKLLKGKRKVGMYPISEDSFLDMGEMEEMHRMEQKLNLTSE